MGSELGVLPLVRPPLGAERTQVPALLALLPALLTLLPVLRAQLPVLSTLLPVLRTQLPVLCTLLCPERRQHAYRTARKAICPRQASLQTVAQQLPPHPISLSPQFPRLRQQTRWIRLSYFRLFHIFLPARLSRPSGTTISNLTDGKAA